MDIKYLALALAALGACSYARVGSGQVAVVRTPDGVEQKVYPPGDWRIGMWDKPTYYTVRSQEREEHLDVLASNGLRIDLDASIRYHIVANEAVALDQELGEDYYSVLLGPTLRSQARRVVGRFQPEEIYSSQRELIERQIREGVETAIKGRHIVLEAVLIRSVKLPDSIQTAINDKLEQEQQALKMKYVLEQAEAEQQQKLMEVKSEAERDQIKREEDAASVRASAQAAADAQRIAAAAAAEAKRLDGQATADYEQVVQRFLTPQVLRMQEIEATKALATSPNAKILYLGAGSGAGSTLLDLRDLSRAAAR
jgi:regulator of protease activity HflC (stomatin/prohibitin superfamily)